MAGRARSGRSGAGVRALALGALAAAAAIGAAAQDAAPAAARTGGVRGRVRVRVEGVKVADLGPTVVYLDAPGDRKLDYEVPAEVPKITQQNATFSPAFLAIAAGQTVEMPNLDEIAHNVFSYSKPNDFDLGIYPKSASRRVRFEHPGVVRLYCSIHASMNAIIFVAPSPWFARADPTGAFEIRGAPPGEYRLRLWSGMVEASRPIVVPAGAAADADLAIEERR